MPESTERARPRTTEADDEKSLPHDRDEKRTIPPIENAQHVENREPIDQAHDDVESGIQDTERIGVPSNVPSSGQNDER